MRRGIQLDKKEVTRAAHFFTDEFTCVPSIQPVTVWSCVLWCSTGVHCVCCGALLAFTACVVVCSTGDHCVLLWCSTHCVSPRIDGLGRSQLSAMAEAMGIGVSQYASDGMVRFQIR